MTEQLICQKARLFCKPDAVISKDSRLKEDLGLDSLKFIMLISAVCADLEIDMADIQQEEIYTFTLLGELVEAMEKYSKEQV